MKVSSNFYDFDIDLKSNRNTLRGTALFKNGRYIISLFGKDVSIRREIGIGSAIDLAKKLVETFDFKCKKCKKKLSLEKGEIHHGCLTCALEQKMTKTFEEIKRDFRMMDEIQNFYELYPHLWKYAFDIGPHSRFSNALVEAAIIGYEQAKSECEDKIYHLSREAPEVEYKLQHEIDRLKGREKILVEALEFYANTINWTHLKGAQADENPWGRPVINFDDLYPVEPCDEWGTYGGKRARKALKKVEELK